PPPSPVTTVADEELVSGGYVGRVAGGVAGGVVGGMIGVAPEPKPQPEYARFEEHAFVDAKREPVTTFAIDVDRASYANVRRFLTAGQAPPPDAVRIE